MMKAADGFSGLNSRKGRPLLERLMERVIPEPNSGCWLWIGGLYPRGYGMAFLPGGKPVLAHRAMLIAHGIDVPAGAVVRHTCDLPCCVNPDHLRIGTQADNMRDMNNKRRHRPAYKITKEWRQKIREDDRSIPSWAFAMWFGVSRETISRIRRGL